MQRYPYGPCAWFVDDLVSPAGWANALAAMEFPGVVDIVPAATSVTVHCTRQQHEAVGVVLDSVTASRMSAVQRGELLLEVVYDGPDLAELAELVGVSPAEVVRLHVSGVYEVAFCGFSPGFGYLRGVDPRLHVPRRDTPRTSVPAGSVGVAASYTCVYPSASPGGWFLIGRTTRKLWDVGREPPALLQPGRTVRFEQVSR